MTKVAIYARVSMSDQNPDMQLAELREYAGRRGFAIAREYVDRITGDVNGRSKAAGRAAEYSELMADASRRRFDVVLVWKFDRFARSLSALLEALQKFEALGIHFISATQDVDTTTPMGRLFFQLVGAFAEFERSLIVERTRAGLENARRRGVQLGRPRDPETEVRIGKLRAEGMSIRQIAERTGRSTAGILKVLRRQTPAAEGTAS